MDMMDSLRVLTRPRWAGDPESRPQGGTLAHIPGGRLERVAVDHTTPSELQVAVERARALAQSSGEFRPVIAGSFVQPVSDELAAFIDRILRDGTYFQAVAQLVADDPELADT
ncbi:MAG: hypothetical protein ACRDZ8_08535 [Acidimicrobiales bacterium]